MKNTIELTNWPILWIDLQSRKLKKKQVRCSISYFHCYSVEGPDAAKKAAAYDVEIEVDDPKKEAMRDFMMSPQSQSVSQTRMNICEHKLQ